jgi:hypothetical protein
MNVDLTEEEVRMLRILLDLFSANHKDLVPDDCNFDIEERFVMKEILDKIGGPIPPFDLATSMDMGYFYKNIRKRMKKHES